MLVGGSGLYVRAALGDLEFPGTDERDPRAAGGRARRRGARAAATSGWRPADPVAAAAILPSNGRRIVRALEVIELSGPPFSATLPGYDGGRPRSRSG